MHAKERHLTGGKAAVTIQELFAQNGRVLTFEPEQPIITKGSPGTDIFLVKSGRVALHASSVLGREFVVSIIRPGELFGIIGLTEMGVRSLDAVALHRSRIAVLDIETFKRGVMEDPLAAWDAIQILARSLQKRSAHLEDFATLSFGGRLAKWLLEMAAEQGVSAVTGATFKCEVPQTLIAEMVGVSRESVNRQLRKWQDQQIVTYLAKAVTILDPVRLRRIAEGSEDEG
jgi:CRP-like cAMP-binding protein